MRTGSQWRYLVIPRDALAQFRDTFETAPRKGPGRPPTTAEEATTDTLNFVIELGPTDASGGGASLANFVEQWPDQLPSLPDGTGKRISGAPNLGTALGRHSGWPETLTRLLAAFSLDLAAFRGPPTGPKPSSICHFRAFAKKSRRAPNAVSVMARWSPRDVSTAERCATRSDCARHFERGESGNLYGVAP